MIKVVYLRKSHLLTMTGHANSAAYGQDLVCASASILAYTLANAVLNMAENRQQVTDHKIVLAEGKALIMCTAAHKYDAPITLVFDSICAGFELLAHDYPEYISYNVQG